jgi:hypothetical protein
MLTVTGVGTARITATQKATANWLAANADALLFVSSPPTPKPSDLELKSQASNNALVALSNALTQLQIQVGPDQRVTATADIFNVNDTNSVAEPYWTGVWKTYNPDWGSDPARQPWNRIQPLDVKLSGQTTPLLRQWSTNLANVVWLVSGYDQDNFVNPFSFNSNNGGDFVTIAKNWGKNLKNVSIPLVAITNETNGLLAGRYGYWVSDEGVKAKINVTEPNLSKKPITSQGMLVSSLVHFLGGASPYLPSVMTNFGVQSASDLRTNPDLSQITNFSDLQNLDPGYAGISNNTLSADFTLWSYGTLCDVRRGGLKQDLTAAMESTRSIPSGFNALLSRSGKQSGNLSENDSLMAYRASSSALPMNLSSPLSLVTSSCIDGLRWQSIYNFYNLYKSQMPQSPSVTVATGTAPRGIGSLSLSSFNTLTARSPFFQDPAGLVLNYSQLTPAVIADSITAELGVTNMSTANGSRYFFQVSYYPLVILYNPYSVALDLGNSSFSLVKNIASRNSVKLTCVNSYGTYYNPNLYPYFTDSNNLWPTNGSITAGLYTNTIFQASNGYAISMTLSNASGTILLPGEIRAYGLQGINSNFLDSSLNNYSIFSNQSRKLVTAGNLTIGSGFGGVTVTLTNWNGATSPSDRINFSYFSLPSIAYNAIHFTPQISFNSGNYTISTWPSTNSSTDLPACLNGTSSGNFPNNTINTTMGQLLNNPVTVFSFTERLKGTVQASQHQGAIGFQTNIPTFLGNSLFLNGPRSGNGLIGNYCPATETLTNLSPFPLVSVINSRIASNASTVSWGSKPAGDDPIVVTEKASNNNVFKVLRDVPLAPITSLGQFMHLDEFYSGGTLTGSYNIFPLGIPGMSIGGSFCCPETGPFINAIYYNGNISVNSQWHLLMDNSFLANEALFDSHFFSTVPPRNGFSWGAGYGLGPFSQSLSENFITSNQSLPNSRMVFYRKDQFDPSVSDLQDESKAAANLLINGAFNVNSTSILAWKSLLTSLNGQTFPIYNFTSGQCEQRYVTNPLLRFWSVGRFNPNDPWDGMRSLSDEQMTALAQEIVNQVRKRGPFLSMGDFLNRRMASTNSYSFTSNNIMGALQEAIENTQTNGLVYDVNSNIHNNSSICTSNNFNAPLSWYSYSGQIYPATNGLMVNLSKLVTNTATGIPGYLMQQDLVQAFAPVMTVRSDTFRIRFYGDSKVNESDTEPKYRAYGEAVVQRVPDYYDQTDPALYYSSVRGISYPLGDATPVYGPSGPIVSQSNQSFGRSFKIVSFRWLTPEEL